MHENHHLIQHFYSAFTNGDAEAMADCYHDEVVFHDPVFGELRGEEAGDMWRALLGRSKDLQIVFSDVTAGQHHGSARWMAVYTFSPTGKRVVNRVAAFFEFRDGKIIRHTDEFSFYNWAVQAFGWKGILLGWTGIMKTRVRSDARKLLSSVRNDG